MGNILCLVVITFRRYRLTWLAYSAVWISSLVQLQFTVVRSLRKAPLLATRWRMAWFRKDAQLLSANERWLPRPSQLQVHENDPWTRQRRTRRHLDADTRPRRLVSHRYTVPCYILHCTTPHCNTRYTTLHYNALRCLALHYNGTKLHCITPHCTAVRYTAFYPLHYITMQYTTHKYATLHPLQYNILNSMYTRLHCAKLQHTRRHSSLISIDLTTTQHNIINDTVLHCATLTVYIKDDG